MKIAVIGSGISGNLAARLLHAKHDVELFESSTRPGGHAHTVPVSAYGVETTADVAFMVLNRRTYPNMVQMLDILGVETQESDMSFSVRCMRSGIEYQGSSLDGLFAQRANLLRPSFLGMLRDIVRFNDKATQFASTGDESMLLGQFLEMHKLGRTFRDNYLFPMSAAIWSADPQCLVDFPAKFILGFFRNHGLLQIRDRPQWLTVAGRSKRYVSELLRPLNSQVRTSCEVVGVRRLPEERVEIQFQDRANEVFDHVVFATHADQTLNLLLDASRPEQAILSAFMYQPNHAVLHTDQSLLPRSQRAWASWNYHIGHEDTGRASVTYDLNRLQSLGLPGPLCLTLNPNQPIDDKEVLSTFDFRHPTFNLNSIEAQRRYSEINHQSSVSFCGAYWGYGFHEDGINSALSAVKPFGLNMDNLEFDCAPVNAARQHRELIHG